MLIIHKILSGFARFLAYYQVYFHGARMSILSGGINLGNTRKEKKDPGHG
jgi:hypothetical protein